MNVNKPKMPLWQKIFYIISFIILIYAFIYLGTKNYSIPKKTLTDAESFTLEYGISKSNPFIYKNAESILETLNTSSALIFMAFPENEWSSSYASILNEVARRENIKEIYYYNFLKDRKNNNHYYENIVNYLKNYTYILDDETINIYSPTFVIVKNGKVIYYDDETAIMNGDHSVKEFWTESKKEEKITEITKAIYKYKGYIYETNE